jgi:SAM-dependent methyltransferase
LLLALAGAYWWVRPRADPALAPVIDAAAGRYAGSNRLAGSNRFNRHFAHGKLSSDPVYLGLLKHELLPNQGRLLDLGCGQGILLSLLLTAREFAEQGKWPQTWPKPPADLQLHGFERRPNMISAARLALGDRAVIESADLRNSATLPACRAVVILDVLHYMSAEEQRDLLQKVALALEPGGVLLMREGDAGAGLSYEFTFLIDHIAALLRGQFCQIFHFRSQGEWVNLLKQLGFFVEALPMHEGTPFANVLYVGRKI